MRTSSQGLVVLGLWNHPPRNGWKIFFGLYIIQKRLCRLLEPVPQNTTHRCKHNDFHKTTDAKKHPNEQKHCRKPWCIQTKNMRNNFLDHHCCFEFEITVLFHPLSHQHIESIFVGFLKGLVHPWPLKPAPQKSPLTGGFFKMFWHKHSLEVGNASIFL